MGMKILTATFRPYLERLHAWVQSGDLSTDACGELFVLAGTVLALVLQAPA